MKEASAGDTTFSSHEHELNSVANNKNPHDRNYNSLVTAVQIFSNYNASVINEDHKVFIKLPPGLKF